MRLFSAVEAAAPGSPLAMFGSVLVAPLGAPSEATASAAKGLRLFLDKEAGKTDEVSGKTYAELGDLVAEAWTAAAAPIESPTLPTVEPSTVVSAVSVNQDLLPVTEPEIVAINGLGDPAVSAEADTQIQFGFMAPSVLELETAAAAADAVVAATISKEAISVRPNGRSAGGDDEGAFTEVTSSHDSRRQGSARGRGGPRGRGANYRGRGRGGALPPREPREPRSVAEREAKPEGAVAAKRSRGRPRGTARGMPRGDRGVGTAVATAGAPPQATVS